MISSSDSSRWTMTMTNRTAEPSPNAQLSSQDPMSGKGKGYEFDLDQDVARQARHLDGRARGCGTAEILGPAIDFVHGGKVVHVLDEHSGLDGAIEVAAGGLEHGAQVLQHLVGLLGDAAGHDVA